MKRDGPQERQFYGLLTSAVQRSRLGAVREYVESPGRVLDAGCGWTSLPGSIRDYVGCDRDPVVLAEVRRRFPAVPFFDWDFTRVEAPEALRQRGPFDRILLLAVLEHVANPGEVLARLASLLCSSGELVLTTPHPSGHALLDLGARLGLLSRHAHEEHEALLGKKQLEETGRSAGLSMRTYRRFLLGLNQLAVFGRYNS
ncbi:MAG: class I SAM-dependent methyltransferase [Acidobacteria bacterium]|nr:class I SAM-dependent methyltransferase [Acidobacteriota bacterium]